MRQAQVRQDPKTLVTKLTVSQDPKEYSGYKVGGGCKAKS